MPDRVGGGRGGRPLVVATRNPGKLRELLPMLDEAGWRGMTLDGAGLPESPDEDAIEAFATFEANALAKARHFARLTGLPTLADDSGLAVDALGGAPGVHSKRWAQRELDVESVDPRENDARNNALLLDRLRGAPDRRASFVCAAAFVEGEREVVRVGACRGRIAEAPSTGVHGFGYDPLFVADELGMTFAEATREQKHAVSHRGRAVRALLEGLAARTQGA